MKLLVRSGCLCICHVVYFAFVLVFVLFTGHLCLSFIQLMYSSFRYFEYYSIVKYVVHIMRGHENKYTLISYI